MTKKLKFKSVELLAFKTLETLIDDEDELWIAHAVYNMEAGTTRQIHTLMRKDLGLSPSTIDKRLKNLVNQKILLKPSIGIYRPNLPLILQNMLNIAEGKGIDKTNNKIRKG